MQTVKLQENENAGDQLAIAKETGRRLGMGTNMYPSSSLLGHNNDEHEAIPVDELIEMADGFAGVFPGHNHYTTLISKKFAVISDPICFFLSPMLQNTSMRL